MIWNLKSLIRCRAEHVFRSATGQKKSGFSKGRISGLVPALTGETLYCVKFDNNKEKTYSAEAVSVLGPKKTEKTK